MSPLKYIPHLTILLALSIPHLNAQNSPTPTPTPPTIESITGDNLPITILSVKGKVQVRDSESDPWHAAQPNTKLPIGASARTAPRSHIVVQIGKSHTLTLDSLGVITLLRAIEQELTGKQITDIGMNYGRARYQIQTADSLEHDAKIRSPSSTLAVRGSDVIQVHNAFDSYALGQGKLEFINRIKRRSIPFGQTAQSKVTTTRDSAGSVAQAAATVDGKGDFAARTETETRLVEQMPGVGGEDLRSFQTLTQGSVLARSFNAAAITFQPTTLTFAFEFGPLIDQSTDAYANITYVVRPSTGQTQSGILTLNTGPSQKANVFFDNFAPGDYTATATLNQANPTGAQSLQTFLLVVDPHTVGPPVFTGVQTIKDPTPNTATFNVKVP